jgi:hypothetical protein
LSKALGDDEEEEEEEDDDEKNIESDADNKDKEFSSKLLGGIMDIFFPVVMILNLSQLTLNDS